MNFLRLALGAALLSGMLTAPVYAAQDHEEEASIQVFLGVLELDDQTGQWDDLSDDPVDINFSSLPSGGMEGEYVFAKGWLHVGLNPGGSIAWKNDDTNISGNLNSANGSTLRIDVDNSLLLVELHLGGYARGRLTDRITAYVAGGPMVMYGSHDVKNDNIEEVQPQHTGNRTVVLTESDSSDTNIGYYARAGLDFQINESQHLGFGIRYMSTELDFDKTVGKVDIKGPQYVLTFTTRM